MTGGESTILDMLPIVEEVKKHKKHFNVLSRISATFQHISYKQYIMHDSINYMFVDYICMYIVHAWVLS